MLNVSKFNTLSAQLVDAQNKADDTGDAHAAAVYKTKVALADQKVAATDHADAIKVLQKFVGDVKAELVVAEQYLRRTKVKSLIASLIGRLFKR